MKVLYISYDGMTDNLGQSQVIPYLKGLLQFGHSFHLISCEKSDKFLAKGNEIKGLLQQLGILWHPLPYTKNPPVLSAVMDVIRMYRKAYSLQKKHHFDAVHCRSYLPAMIGLDMKKKFGTKFIFDMRGFWPDERVDGHLWNLKNPLFRLVYNYFKKKELQFFNYADLNVSLTHAGLKAISSMKVNKQQLQKFAIIPCCADYELFVPHKPDTTLLQQLNLQHDHRILCYLGSLGTWYMFDEMLQMFKHLYRLDNSFRFLFITPEPETFIHQKAVTYQIDASLIKVVSASRQQVPQYLSLAQWGISFIQPCFSKLSSSPTKMGEMLAAGIPLICNSGVGDVERIIRQIDGGIVLQQCSEGDMQQAAQQVVGLKQYSRNDIRERSRAIFALETGVNLYAAAYQKLETE